MAKVISKTLAEVLEETADRFPDNEAIVFPEFSLRMNYEEFRGAIRQLAKGLLALGLEKGEHWAIWTQNRPFATMAQFAAAYLGAPLVVINPNYKTFDLEYVLRQSDSKLLVTIGRFKSSEYLKMVLAIVPELASSKDGKVTSQKFEKLERVVLDAFNFSPEGVSLLTTEQLFKLGVGVADHELDEAMRSVGVEDPINMQYTSGTTGRPKGVLLTSLGLVNNGFQVGEVMGLTPEDRMCIPVPFYHCFHLVLGNIAAVTHGSTMVVPYQVFNAERTIKTVIEEQCTVLHGVPTMFQRYLEVKRESPEFANAEFRLRTGIMAGAPCPIELMRAVIKELGAEELVIAYGLTEASPVLTMTRRDDPLEVRTGSVGRPIAHVELRVVDQDGNDCPRSDDSEDASAVGEIIARSIYTMLGYYKDPEATAKRVRNGWLYTGDLGRCDTQGNLHIVGRADDMIIKGGENIYPLWIEEFYSARLEGKIGIVQVVGVPDAEYGQVPAIVIEPKRGFELSEDEIKLLGDEGLPRGWTPHYVKIVSADYWPLTVTGKIKKGELSKKLTQELGLESLTERKTA